MNKFLKILSALSVFVAGGIGFIGAELINTGSNFFLIFVFGLCCLLLGVVIGDEASKLKE